MFPVKQSILDELKKLDPAGVKSYEAFTLGVTQSMESSWEYFTNENDKSDQVSDQMLGFNNIFRKPGQMQVFSQEFFKVLPTVFEDLYEGEYDEIFFTNLFPTGPELEFYSQQLS